MYVSRENEIKEVYYEFKKYNFLFIGKGVKTNVYHTRIFRYM